MEFIKMKMFLSFVVLILLMIVFGCESYQPPAGTVVITLEEYEALKAGGIIDSTGGNCDSLKAVYDGQLTSTIFHYENIVDSLEQKQKEILEQLANSKSDTIAWKPLFVYVSKRLSEIKPVNVKVDTSSGFNPMNLIDNIPYVNEQNKGTRWAAYGYPREIVFEFDKCVQIDSIEFNIYGWDNGYTNNITIFNYSDSLAQIKTSNELYSGHRVRVVTSQLYFRIDNGNNKWADIGEVKFYGPK